LPSSWYRSLSHFKLGNTVGLFRDIRNNAVRNFIIFASSCYRENPRKDYCLSLRSLGLKLAQLTSLLPFKINSSTKKSSPESGGQSAVKTFLTVHGTRKCLPYQEEPITEAFLIQYILFHTVTSYYIKIRFKNDL
jgi:hypothetical protein